MIWLDGSLGDPARLALSRHDRLFEHGLGLFETIRAADGRAPLLGRHLARLRASAADLGIDLGVTRLPGPDDVAALTEAAGRPDALLRLTVTAGRHPDVAPTAWMTAGPLPPPPPVAGWSVVDAGWTVALGDPLARHKTLNYWARRIATERAQAANADEAIFRSADGRIWEGARTSLFVVQGPNLITPPTSGPILPGVMRGLILELAASAGLDAREADVSAALVDRADEVFVANSVRGPIPVRAWVGREYRPIAPTLPTTARLRATIDRYLDTMSITP